MNSRSIIVETACISALTVIATSLMSAQQPRSAKLSPVEVRTLLRSPNGLEKAANLAGNFTLEKEIRVWIDPSLSGLVGASPTVFVGTMVGSESRVSEDGDQIYTDYHFRPAAFVKGTASGSSDIIVTAEGGKVQFNNGTTAEIKTIEWLHLKTGNKYLLCLQQHGDRYFLSDGFAGAFQLQAALDPQPKLVALAAFSHRPHRVAKDAEPHTPESFLMTVRKLVDEQAQ
jgi:hypothetical protein